MVPGSRDADATHEVAAFKSLDAAGSSLFL